jgi:hypothetical protein
MFCSAMPNFHRYRNVEMVQPCHVFPHVELNEIIQHLVLESSLLAKVAASGYWGIGRQMYSVLCQHHLWAGQIQLNNMVISVYCIYVVYCTGVYGGNAKWCVMPTPSPQVSNAVLVMCYVAKFRQPWRKALMSLQSAPIVELHS